MKNHFIACRLSFSSSGALVSLLGLKDAARLKVQHIHLSFPLGSEALYVPSAALSFRQANQPFNEKLTRLFFLRLPFVFAGFRRW